MAAADGGRGRRACHRASRPTRARIALLERPPLTAETTARTPTASRSTDVLRNRAASARRSTVVGSENPNRHALVANMPPVPTPANSPRP
ncbi:hypothetical protein DNL40_04905 [Xylanimonas oleitrophica]|uniref:Uncharacterized protein n=1 Tax=Xylanimonas oleitrophica TaxID=2607479 RepID=A0A2W5Y7C6_9MICO|nr:hypothetical protein DNL40_04905 [Xylanimonas oleitrophica]